MRIGRAQQETMIVGIDIGTQSLKVAVTDGRSGSAARRQRPIGRIPAAGLGGAGSRAVGACARPDDRPRAGRGRRPRQRRSRRSASAASSMAASRSMRKGSALTPCLIWMDRRAQAEIADVPAAIIRARAGLVLDASHMAAKIRWLKRHDPRAAAAARFHQPVSYLVARLTGRAVMDHALASTTMVYAIDRRGFDSALLDCFEIERRRVAGTGRCGGSCAGPLSAQGAALTGLPAGIPVAVGTGDDFSTPLRRRIARRPGSSPSCSAPAKWSARCIRGWSSTSRSGRDPRLSRRRVFPGESRLAVGRRRRLALRAAVRRRLRARCTRTRRRCRRAPTA